MIRWLIHKLFGVSAYHHQANEATVTQIKADQARRNALQVKVDVIRHRANRGEQP